MELSSLMGKPVLSPAGERAGYVKQAFVSADFVSLTALLCADDEEEEFVLPKRALISLEDAVIADIAHGKTPAGIPCPVGLPVFNCMGAFLGRASGLTVGESGVLIVTGLGGAQIYPSKFIAAGDVVIVYSEPAARAVSRQKRASRRQKNAPHVAKMEDNGAHERENGPSEELGSYRANLLGKRVMKPVIGEHGETLAAAGETVTPPLLQRAREHNRLLELTANTLTEPQGPPRP